MQTFNTGAIKSPIDNRDYLYEDIVAGAGEPFDWDKGFDIESELQYILKVKDQNGSYSCGGQAFSYYAEILDLVNDKDKNEKSARFIYAPVAYPDGGSTARDLSERVIKIGVANESDVTSYENGNPPSETFMRKTSDFTAQIIEKAKSDRADSYIALTSLDIDSVAKMARDSKGCVIGISGKDNGTWLSEFPKFEKYPTWNHWIYVIGAKKIGDKKYIKIINSWGKGVGQNGRQYLSQDFFPSACFEARSIVHIKKLFTKNLEIGMKDPDVKKLQETLFDLGYFTYFKTRDECTDFYGRETAKAVLAFQWANNVINVWQYFFYGGRYFYNKTRSKLNSLL